MKKYFLLSKTVFLLFTVLSFKNSYSQLTNFDKGYADGLKNGYCNNTNQPSGLTCTYPFDILNPSSYPMPQLNESSDSYQDGYNRGFTIGTDRRRADNNANGNNNGGSNDVWSNSHKYTPTPYVQPFDLNLYRQYLMSGAANGNGYNANSTYYSNKYDNSKFLVNRMQESANITQGELKSKVQTGLLLQIADYDGYNKIVSDFNNYIKKLNSGLNKKVVLKVYQKKAVKLYEFEDRVENTKKKFTIEYTSEHDFNIYQSTRILNINNSCYAELSTNSTMTGITALHHK